MVAELSPRRTICPCGADEQQQASQQLIASAHTLRKIRSFLLSAYVNHRCSGYEGHGVVQK